MLEFLPHKHSGKTLSSTTPPPHTTPTLDASQVSLEYLLEQLKKLPFSESTRQPRKATTRSPTTTPSKGMSHSKDPDEKSSYQATLQHYEDVLSKLFSVFKFDFDKSYKSHHEHERRKDIYRHNMR